ncbi:MAG: hypothetical protein IKR68_07640 [Lachnospiraceae bacterium]|nr:hypothetical protein [Lachnospiraceae bacterium]
MLPGVYTVKRKDNTISYRASLTCSGRHISLGSYPDEDTAHRAYCAAKDLMESKASPGEYSVFEDSLPFDKFISLINLRDNGVYFATPIYLMRRFFHYYLSPDEIMTFDAEDLFYFARHRIQRRGGRLFVSDYGMQVTLSTRYGIRPFSVEGRDHEFLNGDPLDFRYENIRIISPFIGVTPFFKKSETIPMTLSYKVRIHVKGYYTVGIFSDEISAAIAYNKAVDHIKLRYSEKNYGQNFIEDLPAKEYAEIYTGLDISAFIKSFDKNHPTGTCNPQN